MFEGNKLSWVLGFHTFQRLYIYLVDNIFNLGIKFIKLDIYAHFACHKMLLKEFEISMNDWLIIFYNNNLNVFLKLFFNKFIKN